jgi:thiol-disulfide isomerase/thioredoxin
MIAHMINETAQEAREPQEVIVEMIDRAGALWETGVLDEAQRQLESAVSICRSKPFEIKLRTRVQLGTMLSGLYLATDNLVMAQEFLPEELAAAEQLASLIQARGTPNQARAATGDLMQMRDLAAQIGLIGRPAPEILVSEWLNTAPLALAELRGKVVLLEFWATWCKQCEEPFAQAKRLHKELSSEGLIVIALTRFYLSFGAPQDSRLEEIELIRRYVAERSINFPVGISNDEATQLLYGASGLPSMALIDRQGIVRHAYGGGLDENFNRVLRSLLPTIH